MKIRDEEETFKLLNVDNIESLGVYENYEFNCFCVKIKMVNKTEYIVSDFETEKDANESLFELYKNIEDF